MAFVYKDRVAAFWTGTGTGNIVVGSVPDASYQAFVDALADGDTCDITIYGAGDFETCRATWTESTTTLARGTIYESSNGGARVNFGAGRKVVAIARPASKESAIAVATNYASLSAAIADASAQGKALYLPAGTYTITNLTIPVGLALIGESYQNTIIKTTTTTGDVVTIGGNAVTIRGIQFQATSARASGWMINATSVAGFHLEDCFIGDANSPNQVLIGNGVSSIYIDGCYVGTPLNGVGLQIGSGAGSPGLDLKIRKTYFLSDTGSRAFANILLENVADLTLADVTIIGAATNIAIAPTTGQYVVFVKGNQVWLDNGTTGLNITPSGTGFARDITFANGWFGNNGNGVIIGRSSTAMVDGINFENNTFLNAAGSGISADATAGGISNIRVSDGYASAHASNAFYFNNVNGVELRGIRVGPYAGNAGNATGITLAGVTDNVYIDNVVATGNTTAYTNSSSGTNIKVHSSPGITATAWTVAEGGTGAVTLTGLVQGNGTSAMTAITSSTTGQVPRVTGANTFAFGALDLANSSAITGDLPFANLTPGSARSVLGVTGNATADVASIQGSAGQILGVPNAGTSLAFTATPQLGASGTLGSVTFGNATSGLLTLQPATGALGTVTVSIPAATDTLVNLGSSQELTNKTLTSSVAKGTWTASGTWTVPAMTLNGAISGGGNNITNVNVGTSSPGTGAFTTLSSTVSSSAGSGTVVGNTVAFTRTTSSGTSDIDYAASYTLTDSGSTNPLADAALNVNSVYNNTSNTTVNNWGLALSATIQANLGTYISITTGCTVSAGTLSNYTAIQILAPSGTVTNKTAISVASGAGAIIQNDTTDATTTTDGPIRSAGGLSVAKNIIGGAKVRCGSYVVASLPSGSAGDMAYASNCRVFNGAGTQEGAGVGTGGLVEHNGTAWKISGTNVTAVA